MEVKKFRSKNIKLVFIVCHRTDLDGPIDYYEHYLISQGAQVTKLSHPLIGYKTRQTTISKQGIKLRSIKRYGPDIPNLFFDFFYSSKHIPNKGVDTIIAANNFDAMCAIFAKTILKKDIKKVIYFGSDFSEERFKHTLLNVVYYLVERIALRYSDLVVSNTKRAETKRLSLGLVKTKSVVVPNGVHLDKLKFHAKEIIKNHFVYVGTVSKEHGLYDLINCLKSTIKHITIIGSGDDLERVLDYCQDNSINYQYIKNASHDYVIKYLQDFKGIGLAPYNLQSKWTYYCSPLKVNEYIACGVPVIVSKVPEISRLVDERKYGVVYDELNENSLVHQIKSFNTKKFNLKAIEFYELYKNDNLLRSIKL